MNPDGVMRSWRCLTFAIDLFHAEILIAVLHDCGALGFEHREGCLLAYFPSSSERERILATIEREMGPTAGSVRLMGDERVDDGRWQERWIESLRPFEVGRRFLILPGKTVPSTPSRRIPLRMTPGRAFGTGEHPTTRMCLALVEDHVRERTSFLDVGTGSGILAIGARLLGATPVHGIDPDEEAILSARRNARANNVEDIAFRVADLEGLGGGRNDVVAANLNGVIVRRCLDRLTRACAGVLIVSGVLVEEQEAVKREARDAGWRCIRSVVDGEWVAFVLTEES